MKRALLLSVMLAPIFGCVSSSTAAEDGRTVSNFLSFTGRDQNGLVAFSVDFIRSGEGIESIDDVEATLHDEQRGWIALDGTGYYERLHGHAADMDGASTFQILSSVGSGLRLVSPANNLVLTADPIQDYVTSDSDSAKHALASTAATLQWSGRTLHGRLIHDRFLMPSPSRFKRLVQGNIMPGLRRLHLRVGQNRDFFAVGRDGEMTANSVVGFELTTATKERLVFKDPMGAEHGASIGAFDWPRKLQMQWRGERGLASFDLKVLDHNQENYLWLPGAHTTAVVSGLLTYGGSTLPLYGMVDLYY